MTVAPDAVAVPPADEIFRNAMAAAEAPAVEAPVAADPEIPAPPADAAPAAEPVAEVPPPAVEPAPAPVVPTMMTPAQIEELVRARHEAERYRAEAEQYRRQFEQREAAARAPKPDWYTDPEGATRAMLAEERAAMTAAIIETRAAASRMFAEREHGREKVANAVKAYDEALASGQIPEADHQRIYYSADPFGEAIAYVDRLTMQRDPLAWSLERLKSDQTYAAKVREALGIPNAPAAGGPAALRVVTSNVPSAAVQAAKAIPTIDRIGAAGSADPPKAIDPEEIFANALMKAKR